MFSAIDIIELLLVSAGAILIFFLGNRSGRFFSERRSRKEKKIINRESLNSNKMLKRPLEEERNKVTSENEVLNDSNLFLVTKLEEYREKLSGLGGIFTSSVNKKRADMMYSLLLKNEALEQLLSAQSETLTDEGKSILIQQLKNTQDRQRLLSEIFDDDVIKKYVLDVLSDKERIKNAETRIATEILTDSKNESAALPLGKN